MRGLNGKNAVITGGGSGIGRAISLRLAEEGCHVGVFDINEDGAAETVDEIAKSGGAGTVQRCDITAYDDVKAGVEAFEAARGSIDILVNNAGWDLCIPFLETEFDFWRKVIDINIYGFLHMHYAVLPGMEERRGGKIVNIASDAGRVGSSGEAVYSVAKGGLIAFTKTIAREFARSDIQVNTICPGPTDTPLLAEFTGEGETGKKIAAGLERAIPLGRLAQPNDLPGAVAFLASSDSNFITGQTISVSGGLTMAG